MAPRNPLGTATAAETASSVGADAGSPLRGSETAPLFVVAESADGDLLYDPSTGSCVAPAHWLPNKEIN